jgi:hypothetical protein
MISRYIPFFIISLGVLTTCQKNVFLELSELEGRKIVVESRILDDAHPQWIRLTYTSSYYEVDWGRPVTDAQVEISIGEKVFPMEPSLLSSGIYFNDTIWKYIRGSSPVLQIKHNNKTYKAESKWNPSPNPDSITIRRNPLSIIGIYSDTLYDIQVHFPRIETDDACYLFNLYMNDTLVTFRPRHRGFLCTDEMSEYVSATILTIDHKILKPKKILVLETRSISREFYEFNKIFVNQVDLSGNPFAGAPPANIPTNITGGAFGFFQVSGVVRKNFEP